MKEGGAPLTSTYRYSALSRTFRYLTQAGLDLIQKLLTYDPEKRITADEALRHPYFSESPLPKDASLFNSFPSIANGEKYVLPAGPFSLWILLL